MVQYIIPLASLLLTFLASLACLRFIFSRQGLYWIIPFFVSVLLCTGNAVSLFSLDPASGGQTVMRFFPLFLSFFWYMMVITFHYALKVKVSRNRFRNDMKKNYTESKFLEKSERRSYYFKSRQRKEEVINSYYRPELDDFEQYNLSSFDN